MKARLLIMAAGLSVAMPAMASTFYDEIKECPVGGEKFTYSALGSITTFGSFPDGMPFGSGYFPIALPECPGNGLVLYRDFTGKEIDVLRTLITSPDYLALRQSDNAYYRAYWLENRLVPSSDILVSLLMRAGWDAKNVAPGGDQALRYTGELVDALKAQPPTEASVETVVLQLRLANALREMKRFDEAATVAQLVVIGDSLTVENVGSPEEAAQTRQWLAKLKADIGRAVSRQDADRYPIDMQEERSAAVRCVEKEFPKKFPDAKPLTAFEGEYCADAGRREAVQKAREQVRKWR